MAASPAAAPFPTPSMSSGSADAGRGLHVYSQPPSSQPQPQQQQQRQQSSRHTELSTTSFEQQKQQQQPPTKRRRIGYACNLCRTKKNRCDGERPSCGPCKERRQECVYSPQRTKISVTQEYIENLRARNRMLEEHLAGQPTQNSQSPHESTYSKESPFATSRQVSDRNPSDASRQQQYPDPPSPTSTAQGRPEQQRQYHDRTPYINERPPASVANRHQSDNHHSDRPRSSHSALPGEYFGESSAFDFITKVTSPNTTDATAGSSVAAAITPAAGSGGGGTTAARTSISTGRLTAAVSARRSVAEASGVGSALNSESLAESSPSTVVFEELLGIGGGIGDGGGSSDLFELPQRSLADRLVASYFKHRHPLNPYLHEGTFRQRYARLWLSKDVGGEEAAPNNLAWLGLVNMVFAFGSEHAQVRPPYHGSPAGSASARPDRARFFKRAKMLAFSSILQARIELVQALLLMSHYLHGSLELNHCWTVIGLAIRTAQELGLYLDSTNFTNDIVEQEIRKRVWWGCFVIDRLVSIKVGRPPTIHDIPAIRVGLPLAVDDEFLEEASNYAQPSHVPSKIEFFNHIVTQCRLLEKVLDTLYDNTPSSSGSGGGSSNSSSAGRETRVRIKIDLPDLLAMSIQLDGELVVWQSLLPPHLRADSDVPEWHFERQRSVLLMRYGFHRLETSKIGVFADSFTCTAFFTSDSLFTDKLCFTIFYAVSPILSNSTWLTCASGDVSWRHVFTALSVLLVYQHLDPHSRSMIGIPPSSDIENVIGQGLEHLQRVGGEIHPLASRYVRSFQQLQTRLQAIGMLSANAPPLAVRGKQQPSTKEDGATSYRQAHTASSATDSDKSSSNSDSATSGSAGKGAIAMPDQSQESSGVGYYGGDGYQEQDNNDRAVEYGDDGFMWAGFDDEFAVIQSALLDSSGWGPGFLDPWAQG
ncbi:n-terminal binuclear zn cluster-containing dna binding domain-containing [Trichoderma arundinaceum]|uniref:N-terminal binuclear zn cluster-containing dna binding domain-containing n=1 Tax=Trichoderma arundinaceum TaxID=490622 RepID=A0A395NHL5_TRIAR|nr:n-terminal binuclear zn cluster-containing dna binding domain-containing [Trichoderma arundinaceum]